MKKIRALLCLLLALCCLLPGLPAARAEDEAPSDERFDNKTWDEVIADFLKKWGASEKDLSMGYYNTVTGEEHYVEPDKYMVSGSMYKVPLNMVFCAKVANGEMDWDTTIGVYKYETILESTIVHSDNDLSKTLWLNLGNGTYRSYRRIIAPLMGEDPDTVDPKFYENNYFTARQMIFCLRELYENRDQYPRLIESMQRAEPTEYFKRHERRFDIAHKYGFLQTEWHLYMNDCGIAFTDDPILLVLFTDNVNKAYEVMTDYCTLMCDYAQYHTALRHVEEAAEAERQAEQARIAAEEAAREAERIKAEGASPSAAPEDVLPTDGETVPAALPSAAPGAREDPVTDRLFRQAERQGLSRTAAIALAGVALAFLIAVIWIAAAGKRGRVRVLLALLLALVLSLGAAGRILWPVYQQRQDRPEGDPQETVARFLNALEQLDYATAYACMEGVEPLGLEREPEPESDRAIVRAMRERFSAQIYGNCTVDGDRAWQLVECRYLDLRALVRDARSETLVQISRYASTHPVSDLYDEDDNYRPELMREAWDKAVGGLMSDPGKYETAGGLQLELCWHDGAWHILPSEKLLELLCGGVDLLEKEGAA